MAIDQSTIAIVAVVVALIALLFGPGIGLRGASAVRQRLRTRSERNHEIDGYLRHSAIFLEGLPHFITQTWAWGPSVPNYGAGGSFPPETPFVAQSMPSVCVVVRDVVVFYVRHSKTQGLPCVTLDEALRKLKDLDTRFWEAVEGFARSKWPLRWRIKVRQLHALQIPVSEHDRIRNLKASARP